MWTHLHSILLPWSFSIHQFNEIVEVNFHFTPSLTFRKFCFPFERWLYRVCNFKKPMKFLFVFLLKFDRIVFLLLSLIINRWEVPWNCTLYLSKNRFPSHLHLRNFVFLLRFLHNRFFLLLINRCKRYTFAFWK